MYSVMNTNITRISAETNTEIGTVVDNKIQTAVVFD